MRTGGNLRGAAIAIISVAVAALNRHALERYFAADPESWAAHLYLSYERMSIH